MFAGMAGVPISPSPSMPVLLFAFGVSLIAAVAFGIAPAWMATRVDPIEAFGSQSLHRSHRFASSQDAGGVPGSSLTGVAGSIRTTDGRCAPVSRVNDLASSRSGARSSGLIQVWPTIRQTSSPHYTGVSAIRYPAFPA